MIAAQIIRFAVTLIHRAIRPGAWFLALTLTVAAGPSLAQPSVSGTYVSASPRSAELIFIVQTPDGRLTGRLESATLNRTGAISKSSVTLEGAADGMTLLLIPRSTLLSLGSPPSFSGVIESDDLNLSWHGGHRVFRRGTAEQFRAAVASLEGSAVQIEALIAFDEAMTRHGDVIQIADAIEARTPDLRERLADASERYRDLFPRLHSRRRAQAALSNFPTQGLAAMRAGTDAQSHALEIDAVGLEIVRLRTEIHRQFETARTLAASIDAYCTVTPDAARTPPCAGAAAQRDRLERLRTVVQSEFDATEVAFREASGDTGAGQRIARNVTRP